MNINKKLDRVKQWAGEKMGAEAKTNVSDEFKSLELEMLLRHEGMEKLHKAMTNYVKSLSNRSDGDDKEKRTAIANLGQTMLQHGEDFEPDSEFGNCLISMGRTNERIARAQESYIANATTGWLESLERSLAMMKEYQSARKKLENRRLAYDASLSKMQKAKKEDFRVEEELRSQKAKYEETNEDVLRRMQDIKEAEGDSVADLGAFLDAELEYYDRCRDELLRLKREWPAGQGSSSQRDNRRPGPRSRSNTVHAYNERYSAYQEPAPVPEPEARPSIRSQGHVPSSSRIDTLRLDTHDGNPEADTKIYSQYGRSSSNFQGPISIRRDSSMNTTIPMTSSGMGHRQNLVPHDPGALRSGLRPTNRSNMERPDVFGDPSDDSTMHSGSPDRSYGERSVSPATSHGSVASNRASYPTFNVTNARKGPPPPPPSRSKKPPPPPPVKRADLITIGQRY